MKRIITALAALCTAFITLVAVAADDGLAKDLLDIQHEWEHIHYQLPRDQQEAAYTTLEKKAEDFARPYRNRAEPLVWQAIVLSTHAGVQGGLGALSKVRAARDLLEQAERIDATALDGSIYTSLGSLYYQVPGWPLGFGDNNKAEALLKKALALNPTGIDANYFYGDFLYRKGQYGAATAALEKVLRAPARPDRPLADEGRRKEAQALLAKIRDKT